MEHFDPYQAWLDIPPSEQPPNYYRLLSLRLFEDDPKTIAEAAHRATVHVRRFDSGSRAMECRKLIDRLQAAQGCLLDPSRKQQYDTQLRTMPQSPEVVIKPPPPVPGGVAPASPEVPIAPVSGSVAPKSPEVPISPVPGGTAIRSPRHLPNPAAPSPGAAGTEPRVGPPAPPAPVPPVVAPPATSLQVPPAAPVAPSVTAMRSPTAAPVPPTADRVPPTAAPVPPTAAPVPPTAAPAGQSQQTRWTPPERTGKVGKSVTSVVAGRSSSPVIKTSRGRQLRREVRDQSSQRLITLLLAGAALLVGLFLLLAVWLIS